MEAKHTTGNWQLEQLPCQNPHWAVFNINSEELLVARVEAVRHYQNDCAEANARLMAAAPKLLDAVRRLVEYIPVECQGVGDDQVVLNTLRNQDLAFAKAAIALVDGDAPKQEIEPIAQKLTEVAAWCHKWLKKWATKHGVDYCKVPYLGETFFKAVDKRFGSVNQHTGGGCYVSYLMVDGDHYIGITEENVVAYYRTSGAQLQSHEDAANADSDHWKEFNIISLL